MSDLLITEADVAAFVAHLNEWAATLSENEQAILAMFATRAMAGAAAEPEVAGFQGAGLFEVSDYSFDIEQVLNIGSATSGAGAGKLKFNEFTISKRSDSASPSFFRN